MQHVLSCTFIYCHVWVCFPKGCQIIFSSIFIVCHVWVSQHYCFVLLWCLLLFICFHLFSSIVPFGLAFIPVYFHILTCTFTYCHVQVTFIRYTNLYMTMMSSGHKKGRRKRLLPFRLLFFQICTLGLEDLLSAP